MVDKLLNCNSAGSQKISRAEMVSYKNIVKIWTILAHATNPHDVFLNQYQESSKNQKDGKEPSGKRLAN